jgi:hypothetical protein
VSDVEIIEPQRGYRRRRLMSGDPGGLTHEHRDLLFDLDGLPRLAERAVDPICGAESADGGAFGSIMMSCSTLAASGDVPKSLSNS